MKFKRMVVSAAAFMLIVSSAAFPAQADGGEAADSTVSGAELVENDNTEALSPEADPTENEVGNSETGSEETESTEAEKPEGAAEEGETPGSESDGEEKPEEVSVVKEYSVFEAIRIRRDLLAKGNNYTLKDYKNVAGFLVNNSEMSARYFTFRYDTGDADPKAYKDLKVFDPKEVLYKKELTIMTCHLEKDGYLCVGWEYDGVVYNGGMTFKMPACDVVMKPAWIKRCSVTYNAGDYDGIVGNNTDSVMSAEGANYYLADAGRFSRKGYYIAGWKCINDGLIYMPRDQFKIGSEDVVFEAVWDRASYPVTITANNAAKDKLTVWVQYDSDFVFPECEFVNEGKTFAGWKYNKEIYQPGDSFKVPAMISGSKIVISAVWE